METLAQLFGSAARVKLMRLFLFNIEGTYTIEDIKKRTGLTPTHIKKELASLEKVHMLRHKGITRIIEHTKRGKKHTKKLNTKGWSVIKNFEYLSPLQSLLINMTPLKDEELISRLGKVGRLKFVVVSGVFTQDWDSRVDLLVVGDRLNLKSLDQVMRSLEAEIGKEIQYSAFETQDFQYRLGMYDKLVRDILDFPHRKILDKLGIVT